MMRALQYGALFICAWLFAVHASADDSVTRARVARALDGDSLLLQDGRQVRLLGINAPEFGKNDSPEQPLARAARDRADALVRDQAIELHYDAERKDRHGRLLAYAYLPDGRDLQEILLRDGFAWYVAVPPNTLHLDRYRAVEAEARSARRGVWGISQYEPIATDRLTGDRTGFQRITGTIQRTKVYEDGVECVLSSSVRVFIAASVLKELRGNPRALQGKRLLARGWITEYKGRLRLRLNHPAMLEELS